MAKQPRKRKAAEAPERPPLRADHVCQALEARFPAPEWASFRELRQQTGFQDHRGSIRTIDFAAFNTWPSKGGHRVAVEVKVSRGDFLQELRRPEKHAWCEQLFHETYFAAPAGLIKREEVPEKWGLLEVRWDKSGGLVARAAKVATRRAVPGIGSGSLAMAQLVMSVLRAAGKITAEAHRTSYGLPDGTVVTPEEVSRLVAQETRLAHDRIAEKSKRLETELRKAQATKEPLTYLLRAAGEWGLNEEKLTRDDVEKLISRAAKKRMRELSADLRAAHATLGKMLEAAKDEELSG